MSRPPDSAVAGGLAVDILPLRLQDPQHVEALLALLDHYAQDPMGGGQGLRPEVRERLVPALRQRADFVGFLAFHQGQAVGLVHCFEGFSTFAAAPLLNIHDLAVHLAWRGRGIGRALVAAAEQAARARGCCKLTLEVLSANQPALAAYHSAGFAPYALDPAAGTAIFLQKLLTD